MHHQAASPLWILFAAATFWAYTVTDALIREYSAGVTWLDLAVLAILGAIAGATLSQSFAVHRR